jgi:hypothetical protein
LAKSGDHPHPVFEVEVFWQELFNLPEEQDDSEDATIWIQRSVVTTEEGKAGKICVTGAPPDLIEYRGCVDCPKREIVEVRTIVVGLLRPDLVSSLIKITVDILIIACMEGIATSSRVVEG